MKSHHLATIAAIFMTGNNLNKYDALETAYELVRDSEIYLNKKRDEQSLKEGRKLFSETKTDRPY